MPQAPWRKVLWMLLGLAGLWANMAWAGLRFASLHANQAFLLAVLLVCPWMLVHALVSDRRRWTSIFAIPAGIMAGLWSLFVLLIPLIVAIEFRNQAEWNGTWVRIYRRNGGATTSYWLDIDHERTVLPGLVISRPLKSFYRCYDLDLEPIATGIRLRKGRNYCEPMAGGFLDVPMKPGVR